ncbi:MAG TPA: DUF3307 domain-containing protein [Candidatus Gracilibacteria bacterium]|nr:DUF3307 domain-containing protein [Candidatus Gracilibacteria bacterium]
MPFIYLIFAHLAADFILQPAELIKWKYRNWRGVAFHAVIHLLFYFTVFFAYLPDWKVISVLTGLAVAHFVIDTVKVKKESGAKSFVGTFFIDQLIHGITIAIAGWLMLDRVPHFEDNQIIQSVYGDFYLAIGLCLLILVSYAMEVAKFQFVRKTVGEARFKPNYKSMAKRVLLFSIIYAVILLFSYYRTAALG